MKKEPSKTREYLHIIMICEISFVTFERVVHQHSHPFGIKWFTNHKFFLRFQRVVSFSAITTNTRTADLREQTLQNIINCLKDHQHEKKILANLSENSLYSIILQRDENCVYCSTK